MLGISRTFLCPYFLLSKNMYFCRGVKFVLIPIQYGHNMMSVEKSRQILQHLKQLRLGYI